MGKRLAAVVCALVVGVLAVAVTVAVGAGAEVAKGDAEGSSRSGQGRVRWVDPVGAEAGRRRHLPSGGRASPSVKADPSTRETTTTFVRVAEVPGASIVGNAEAEVLDPPLRIEGPAVEAEGSTATETSTSTTFVRAADVPGASIVGNAEAEVLGPPLRIEGPASGVPETQVTRPPDGDGGSGGLTAVSGSWARPAVVVLFGLGLVVVGFGVHRLATGRVPGGAAVSTEGLVLRWLEPLPRTRPRTATVVAGSGPGRAPIVFRFLEVPARPRPLAAAGVGFAESA